MWQRRRRLQAPVPDPGAAGRPAGGRSAPTAVRLFCWYLRWYFHRRFHAVRVARERPAAGAAGPAADHLHQPSILVGPGVCSCSGGEVLPGRHRVRADGGEPGAVRYGVLQRMGVFGVAQHDRRGAATSCAPASPMLAQPRPVLWITAEGAFTDPRTRPVTLRPGIAHLARRCRTRSSCRWRWNTASGTKAGRRRWRASAPPWSACRRRVARNASPRWRSAVGAQDRWTRWRQNPAARPGLFLPLVRGGGGHRRRLRPWRRCAGLAAGPPLRSVA